MSSELIIVMICTMLATGLFVWTIVLTLNESFAKFEERYNEAGQEHLDALYMTMDPKQLMTLSVACGMFFGFMGYLLGGTAIALVMLGGGIFAPLFWLKKMKEKRQALFNEQLIDCLGTMSNSLRSGFTVPQSVELVSREMDNPIALEFRIASAEMKLGLPPVEAMQNMTKRMPIADLDLVVTAMSIAEGVGGNLGNILNNIAGTIRERFRVEGRIKSLSAMGRMQGLVLVCMPFVLVFFMAKMQPDFIDPLLNEPIGQLACGAGLIWLFLGHLSIKKIVDIDV